MKAETLTRTIPEELAGQRLDQALARLFPEYSRSRLKSWLLGGALVVDGGSPRPRDPVFGGETVRLQVQPETAVTATRAGALVRRITGGGAIHHQRELTFSLGLPLDHPLYAGPVAASYERVHALIAAALAAAAICLVVYLAPAPTADDFF